MKDKEIEVKFIISNETKEKIINDLENVATKTGESHLIDTYYVPNFKSFEINNETVECVRIRENYKGCVLCYKKIHKEANPIYCDEFETKIENKEQLEKILFALGFTIDMIIDKTRQTFKFGDFEFDFDSVKNLGEFMEVEFKSENADIEDIFKFVAKYGLSQNDINHEGIQNLMKKAKNR